MSLCGLEKKSILLQVMEKIKLIHLRDNISKKEKLVIGQDALFFSEDSFVEFIYDCDFKY